MSAPPGVNPALALQMNVKQNAQELTAYLKDLQNWSGAVKQKDEALKSGELVLTKTSAATPPIRGAANASKAQPVLLPSSASADDARFAECKAAGNAAFAAGRFDESLPYYSQCMLLNPRDAIIPSNRSQSLLKLSRWHEAEVDATTAISLDPSQVKALFRRAQARRQLRKYAGALEDCQAVEKLDPSNKAAKALGVEVSSLLQKQQEAKARAAQPIVSSAPVKPAAAVQSHANAAAASVPASGARRMVIQEEESDDDEEPVPIRKVETHNSSHATDHTQSVTTHTASNTRTDTTKSSHAPHSTAAVTQPSTSQPLSSSHETPAASTSQTNTGVHSSSQSLPSSSSPSTSHPSSVTSSHLPPPSPPPPPLPTSAYDFDVSFRSLRSDPQQLASLLRIIPHQQYSHLMKTALDSGMIKDTINAVAKHIMPVDSTAALTVLDGLSTVPRFNVARMMIGTNEKQIIAEMMRQAKKEKGKEEGEGKRIDEIAARYAIKL